MLVRVVCAVVTLLVGYGILRSVTGQGERERRRKEEESGHLVYTDCHIVHKQQRKNQFQPTTSTESSRTLSRKLRDISPGAGCSSDTFNKSAEEIHRNAAAKESAGQDLHTDIKYNGSPIHSESDCEYEQVCLDKYFEHIHEMFPDMDIDYLRRECQNIQTEEDYMRFINNVISNSYPRSHPRCQLPLNDFEDERNGYSYIIDESCNLNSSFEVKEYECDEHHVTAIYETKSHDGLSDISSDNLKDALAVLLGWEDDSVVPNGEVEGTKYPASHSHYSPAVNDAAPLGESSKEKAEVSNGECAGAICEDINLDDFDLSVEDSEEWMSEKTAELINLFPKNDPSFLRMECRKFNCSLDAMNEFVISKLEKNDMPSRKEYEERLKMEELENRYTKNFSIEDFLKVIPDPWSYFERSDRNCKKYKSHSLAYLKSAFRMTSVRTISDVLERNKCNLYKSYKDLSRLSRPTRTNQRHDLECNAGIPTTVNIQFLQEVAFIKNEKEILHFIQERERKKKMRIKEAKMNGTLLQCGCCFDSEVLVEDAVYCPNDHICCKNCIIKFVNVEMGEGRHEFSCLVGCGMKYGLTEIQNVVAPETFSKIIQAIQMEDIKAAGIEDLVHCPFCNYATIMPPEVKVMECMNPECQIESCRLCQELSHVPLRCGEVEKSEETKMRIYIENKMTEALVRTCLKCNKKFIKEDGCNKMICSCGAVMCYVCRKPIEGYSHFNGQGGNDKNKCPLWTTNDELHVDLVRVVGEEAKEEVLRLNPDKMLKHDPTAVLPKRQNKQPMPGMNEGAALPIGLNAVRENRLRGPQNGTVRRTERNNPGAHAHDAVPNRNQRRHNVRLRK